MSRFDEYFLMKEADVIDYVREKIQHLFSDEELLCKEIGDGNINYIYKVLIIILKLEVGLIGNLQKRMLNGTK